MAGLACYPPVFQSNLALFADILKYTENIHSIIEFGSNIGLNLRVIKELLPNIKCSAVEINHKAVEIMRKDEHLKNDVSIYEESILSIELDEEFDFVLIKGVLIHINPDELKSVYEKLYHASKHYICIVEYYNPSPVMVNYRGNDDRLFKRDWAGEFLDLYQDCKLVDYGFVYHRDKNFPLDDATWFLIEKAV